MFKCSNYLRRIAKLSRCYSNVAELKLSNTAIYSATSRLPNSLSKDLSTQYDDANLNKFMLYPTDLFNRVITPFVKPELDRQLRMFDDLSLLIRRPAVDIIKCLRQKINLSNSKSLDVPLLASVLAPRIVLHGQPGSGVTVQLAQVAHFAAEQDWFIFRFSNEENWLDKNPDKTPSGEKHQLQHRGKYYPGDIMDFPSRSATWLQNFLALNNPMLAKWNPVITQDVEWAQNDVAFKGTPWVEIIDYATKRTKYSTDCIGILLRELRTVCNGDGDGPFALLAIDGANFLWSRSSRMTDPILNTRLYVERIALVNHLRRALRGDWSRGAVVCTLGLKAAYPSDRERYTLGYLLSQTGFDLLDPFIPIEVNSLTRQEIDELLNFYVEHNWLTNPAAFTPSGRSEIEFLADGNADELFSVVSEW